MAPAMLDADQLKTLVAIADTGSFTRAADDVNKTQAAVSMQMRRLEETAGQRLFVKNGRRNKLTPRSVAPRCSRACIATLPILTWAS